MKIKAFVFDAYGTLYDVQSISRAINAAFPGHGEYITQVWRLKQLEYSWLRSLMGRYEDFLTVSRESLEYTLGTLGLVAEKALVGRLIDAYNDLSPLYVAACSARDNISPNSKEGGEPHVPLWSKNPWDR